MKKTTVLLLTVVSLAFGAVVPYFENFESGANGWTTAPILGVTNDWALGTPNKNSGSFVGAFSGVNAWVTGLNLPYRDSQYSGVLSPSFSFANVSSGAVLSFYAKWDLSYGGPGSEIYFDGVIVQYKLNGAGPWNTLGVNGEPVNWYNAGGVDGLEEAGWSGVNAAIDTYTFVAHTLPPVVYGKNVQFLILLGSDGSQGAPGFAFDDFSIQIVPPPSCATLVGPADGASVSPNLVLSWTPFGTDAVARYNVYVGSSPTPSNYMSTTATSLAITAIGTFYWQVVPFNLVEQGAAGCPVRSAVVYSSVKLPYSTNFESGTANWTTVSVANGNWVLGNPAKSVIKGASSGNNAWITESITDDYQLNSNYFLYTPYVDFTGLPANNITYIEFMMWVSSEKDYDGTLLQYSTNIGRNWTTLGVAGDITRWYGGSVRGLTSQSGWSGDTGRYVYASHVLPASLNGNNVLFRFRFGSDGNIVGNGFALDDFAIKFANQNPISCSIPVSPASGSSVPSPVTLAWMTSTNETALISGFKLYFASTSNFTGIQPMDAGSQLFAESMLLPAGTYYWKIVPYNVIVGDAQNCPTNSFTVAETAVYFPYFEDFESGKGGWVSGGASSTWEFGTPNKPLTRMAASGVNCWINGNLTDIYRSDEVSFVQSPLVNLTGAGQAVLSMKITFSTEELFDGAVVQMVSYASGWQTIGGVSPSWYNCSDVASLSRVSAGPSGWCNSAPWMQVSLPLPANPKIFKLRVLFASDSSTELGGFAFDDVSIAAPVATQPPTSSPSVPATSPSSSALRTSGTSAATQTSTLPSATGASVETSETVVSSSQTLGVAVAMLLAMLVVL